MAMAEKRRKINLLPNKGDSLVDQFLTWGLTVGRLLVIITETLALSVFIYRFSLDVQIVDLHDQIKSASAIVASFQENEETYRNLHTRLAFAKEYDSKKNYTLDLMKDVLSMGQNKITFKNLLVSINGIDIEAQAFSPANLASFIQILREHPEVASVSVDRVENSTSTGLITVSLSVDLKTNIRQTSISLDNPNTQTEPKKQQNSESTEL